MLAIIVLQVEGAEDIKFVSIDTPNLSTHEFLGARASCS